MTGNRVLLAVLLTLGIGFAARAEAVTIQFQATNLADATAGEDLWKYQYFLSDFPFPADFGFAVFFDADYESLANAVAPADFDAPVLADYDPALDSAGFFDTLALVDNASVAGEFSVEFVWLGAGAPGSQPFEIYDFTSGEIAVVQSGTTVPLGGNPIPEPGTLLLIAAGGAGLMRSVRQRRKKVRASV